ncbi:hypothetical protein L083_0710 [Actinoplanes sp. N902-109]|nr:hypothetical protein L083_0710 [Actinoplanes sp. N902-109]
MNGERLQRLGVDAPHLDPLHATLLRLFPALAEQSRRDFRRRGVSDPDYVERYFNFMPGEGDTSDAELLAGLQQTARGTVRGPDLLATVLRADPDDLDAQERSAALLRRMEGLTERLTDQDAAYLLANAVGYLPLPARRGLLLGGPDAALARWMAALLNHTVEEQNLGWILTTLSRRGVDAMIAFLRAVPRAAGTGDAWQNRLARRSAERGWQVFLDHVRAGDDAPDAHTATLYALIEGLAGTNYVDRGLQGAVDEGVPVVGIASRLVQVASMTESDATVIIGFDADALVARLGSARVLDGLPEQDPGPAPVQDSGWADRARFAVPRLRAAVAEATGLTERRIPSLPTGVPQPFGAFDVNALNTPGAELPDLRIAVTVMMPSLRVPGSAAPAAGPAGEDREMLILRELESSSMTRWLQAASGSGWPLAAQPWQLTDVGDGRRLTRAAAGLRWTGQPEPTFGWRQRTPVLTGAQILTGTEAGTAVIVADLAAGLWLAELTSERTPDELRHDSRPLPAALSLMELSTLVHVAVRSAVSATEALHRSLLDDATEDASAVVRVRLTAAAGLPAAVDLSMLTRMGTNGSYPSEQSGHFLFSAAELKDRGRLDSKAMDAAVALIGEWLLRSGFRRYEATLLGIGAWLPVDSV